MIQGSGSTETYSSSGPFGSKARYVAQCFSTRPADSIASFGFDVVPDVVQRIATSSPLVASASLS